MTPPPDPEQSDREAAVAAARKAADEMLQVALDEARSLLEEDG